jgi:hypothetical protein
MMTQVQGSIAAVHLPLQPSVSWRPEYDFDNSRDSIMAWRYDDFNRQSVAFAAEIAFEPTRILE